MPTAATPPHCRSQDGDLLAAVDLGSNSFHMVVARYVLGQLRIVDRLRETVRLAEGLDGKGGLDAGACASARWSAWRASASACATSRRSACARSPPTPCAGWRAPQAFLVPAETALGHAIEVVSGREEARLIYLGVAHAQPPKPGELRLVIDIGGGSHRIHHRRGLRGDRAREPADGLRRHARGASSPTASCRKQALAARR